MYCKFMYVLIFTSFLASCSSSIRKIVPIGVTIISRPVIAEVEIDSIRYLDVNIEKYNLGPIGGLQKLSSLIPFPEIASRAGITGLVKVRAFINHKGDVDSAVIINSNEVIFNAASIFGVKRVKFISLPEKDTTHYSVIVTIRFSITRVDQVFFRHKPASHFKPGYYEVSIRDDGTCNYLGIKNVKRLGNFSGNISVNEYLLAVTAIRNQILMLPNIIHHVRNDSTIIVNYTENGKTQTFVGSEQLDGFWTIDAIFEKIMETTEWTELPTR